MLSRRLQQLGARVRRRVIAFLDRRAPDGYEDETGFHFGPRPKPGPAAAGSGIVLPPTDKNQPSRLNDAAAGEISAAAPAGANRGRGRASSDLRLAVWNEHQQFFDFRPRT
jgi:hypothetical protein